MTTFEKYRPPAGGAVAAYGVTPMALVALPQTAPMGTSPR
jgi:hypothetical protein